MSQIHVDSARLREFALRLNYFAEFTESTLGTMKMEIGRLGDTWQDQEYEAFINQFQRTQRKLNKFATEVKSIVPLLQRDADAIDEYLKAR